MKLFWMGLAALGLGCAPVMLASRDQGFAFAAAEGCAQGPYEYQLTTVDNPTGQRLVLGFAEGGAPAQLRYRVTLDGNALAEGKLGTTQREVGVNSDGSKKYEAYTPPSACVVPGAPGAVGAGPQGGPTGGYGAGGPAVPAAPAGPPPVAVRPPVRELSLDTPGPRAVEIDLSGQPPGKTLVVVIWSEQPYPLENARIDILLERLYPKDPVAYAEWQEKQAQKDRDRATRRQERNVKRSARLAGRSERRAERRERERAREAEALATYGPGDRAWERRERKIESAAASAATQWEAFLKADAVLKIEIETFAAPEQRRALELDRVEKYRAAFSYVSEAYSLACGKAGHEDRCQAIRDGEYRAARAWESSWVERNPDALAKPSDPPGPPPLPWAEEKGEPPVLGAKWRAGYWQWDGFYWAWYPGDWEIPAAPVAVAGPTAPVAPPPPPPPQAEAVTPAPAQGYVYIRGAWRWNGKTYVWKTGVWKPLPPR